MGCARCPSPFVRHARRHGDGNVVRGVGARCAWRDGARRVRSVGRDHRTDACPGIEWCVGAVRSGCRTGPALQVQGPRARRFGARQGRSDGVRHRGSTGHRLCRHAQHARVARRTVAGRARRSATVAGTDERVRGTSRFVATGTDLSGARRPTGRICARNRVHARGAHARRRASFRRVVGLSGDLVLRADRTVRHSRRVP